MKRHIGTKLINAKPMTRAEYNIFRGWGLPADENGFDDGFLVEYVDGGAANTEEYSGYVSWSPKDVFERAYKPIDGLPFGLAIDALKQGLRVARSGWNGKGMWLELIGSSDYQIESMDKQLLPWIGIKTADDKFAPWPASQTDILSEDWIILKD